MPRSIIESSDLESKTFPDATPASTARLTGPRFEHFSEHPFPRLFEDQVARHPSQTAVACEEKSLTYGELNARANQLARHLRARGVGRDTLVGICIDRSLEMAVAILGILKSGGAYLPLDPEYPTERLVFMMEDARPKLVLTKSSLAQGLPRGFDRQDSPLPLGEESDDSSGPLPNPRPEGEGNEAQVVLLDHDWPEISRHANTNLTDGPEPDDLAYVIYTSGSTGKPKGVLITHGNLANYLEALNHELQISADDRYLHTASIAFSSSRRQLMLPLSQGATVVIASSDDRKDPLALFALIKQRSITVMDAVPSFWRNCTTILLGLSDAERGQLLDNRLRLMLSASEPMLSDIPQTWMKHFGHPARHVHMFGQTETAGIVCLHRVANNPNDEVQAVPIGNPIANTEIYILDEQRRPCAVGEAGELYIGGAGVGRGYLNRPELTAEKFILHPFSEQKGARLYRTGDWARLTDDRQIEFAGRRDQQVKLRGFRIELGEVETTLAKHPALRESVVVARGESNEEKSLIAYFVPFGAPPTVGDLRQFLSAQLPDYAVPSAFVQLAALPLSANGKVNRLALPDVEIGRPQMTADFVAPRNEIEERLAAIWSEVLRLPSIGVNDNFFELGGHSLLAAQIVSRVRREFGIEIPLRAMFESPTVAHLAHGLVIPGAQHVDQSIKPGERDGTAPLSFTQQQFWLLDQAGPDRAAYNVCTAVKIAGALNAQRLCEALEQIVARHEVLRTSIVVEQGTPVQKISPAAPIALRISDLTKFLPSKREAEMNRALAAEAGEPFDLSQGFLFRTHLLNLNDNEHILLLTFHHIVYDGWSEGLLLRELAALYKSAGGDALSELPRLSIQYADFARWQRQWLQGATLERQLDYWKRELANAPSTLDLPADYARPTTRSFKGAQQSVLLPRGLCESLQTLSRNENATLFMTLLAAFQTLLFRYSGQEDIIVGSPVAGRTMLETENLVGAFVNTLALRADVAGNPSFCEFLGRVRETVLGAFSHQDLPFEKLVEELNPERGVNRTPLFQVMFAFQNTPEANLALSELKLTPLKSKSATAKFDLTLEVEEQTEGLLVTFEYSTDLFAPETIERLLAHFQNLLTGVVADPTQRVADLTLLSQTERDQQLVGWNETGADFPLDTCVHRLFEAQVVRTPEAIAAEFQGEQLTYRELNRRANQLAHYLQKQGVGPEVLVGICVERRLEMLVSMLGVLKAGGGYVPLDPKYPRERTAFMIEDAGLSLVLTHQRLSADIPAGNARLLCIEQAEVTFAQESIENPTSEVAPKNLAYLIYTSGSTGNPKGVMIEHRSLAHFTRVAAAEYSIKPGDRVLQFASLSFDLSVEEIYPALTQGATVVLRTDAMINSAPDFLNWCEEWKVSVLDLPTAYWHELVDTVTLLNLSIPASVRLVIIGGEKALPERVIAWKKMVGERVRLVNTYGPTETTVATTMYDVKSEDEISRRQNVSIGRPIANTTAYILDELLNPVPIGVAGELHIGGAGMARGYINRPDLTAQKFIANPFSNPPNSQLYKTGDLVRYRADGNIEFLGRVDNQIKIRGFRVELEEIEHVLRQYAGVSDCVVVLREDHNNDHRLVAYVVVREQSRSVVSELRNFLKAKLPSYMVPAAFEMIGALPVMTNGKIDRRALPEPQTSIEMDESFTAPRTPIEELLAATWREVLKLEQIGIHDNFFDLGGHSLLAARVVSNVLTTLDVEFGMVDVFQAPTIASLAELLYPRAMQQEPENELSVLLAELEGLSDEEALSRFEHESQTSGAAAV
jgi:amino acid adenylation domain-containing protein